MDRALLAFFEKEIGKISEEASDELSESYPAPYRSLALTGQQQH